MVAADPTDVLDELWRLSVTVTLGPGGQLHARPRPVPQPARDLIQTHRELLYEYLLRDAMDDAEHARILGLSGDDVVASFPGSTVVGTLLPVDGNDLDSYSDWVATTILEIPVDAIPQGSATHLPFWAPPGPRWPSPAPIPAPAQAVALGAEGRRYGHKIEDGKPRYRTVKHDWARCDVCGQGTMRKRGAGAKRCVVTPGCQGKHTP